MTHFITDGLQLTEVRPARQGGRTSAAAGAPGTQQIEEAVLQQAVGGRLMLPGYRSEVAAAAQAAAAPVSSDGAGQAFGRLWVVWALRGNRAEQQEEILDLLRRELPKQGIEVCADGMLGCRVGGASGRAPVGAWHCVAAQLACLLNTQAHRAAPPLPTNPSPLYPCSLVASSQPSTLASCPLRSRSGGRGQLMCWRDTTAQRSRWRASWTRRQRWWRWRRSGGACEQRSGWGMLLVCRARVCAHWRRCMRRVL